ncbi:uncharacterized protein LOC118416329 [Branchiostoma floridae]|uniref:Uncharacterized protein LOC118416329 n=1 Tax=Branchiostoma floridae TaxID=7739 RepID=A0A9J7MQT3_BRAFL|nr:uncharacterized protein LOC118416329 [Branchiostoma floridae]
MHVDVIRLDWTSLHVASHYGQTEVAELLIKNGADLEARGRFDRTSLHVASECGQTEVAELLIKNGANLEARDYLQSTPLQEAAVGGHTGTCELLIRSGADLTTKDKNQSTPLHKAAAEGHTGTCELLIHSGADVMVQNKHQDTPLHKAAARGHTGTCELLIRSGADVTATDKEGKTPLDYARDPETRQHLKIIPHAAEMVQGHASDLLCSEDEDPLIRNRTKLIRDLTSSSVMGDVLNHLLSRDILSDEEYERIRAKETPQDKARELLDTIGRKGAPASRKFKDVMDEVNPHAAEMIKDSSDLLFREDEDLGIEDVSGDPDVPIEVLLRGPEMAKLYSQARDQGFLTVHSTRVPVVGQFRSGKSCFIKRLMGETVRKDEEEPITDGIHIISDVQTKTWKKSPEEIDELAGPLLPTETSTGQEMGLEEQTMPDSPSQGHQGQPQPDSPSQGHQGQPQPDSPSQDYQGQPQPGSPSQEHQGQPQPDSPSQEHQGQPQPDSPSLEHQGQPQPDSPSQGHQGQPQPDSPSQEHQGQPQPDSPSQEHQGQPLSDSPSQQQTNIEDEVSNVMSEKQKTDGIPDNLLESAERMLKAGITQDELGTATNPRLSFWDFGGQATYYGTHHCFITPRGVYILVMSLLQKLSDPVPDQDHMASVDNLRTGGDYLDHWLNSVHSHTQQHKVQPPVVIVLTHKDMVSQEYIDKYKEEIRSHIKRKAAGKLVMSKIFAVDNTTEDAAVDEIRDYIREVARALPHMGEEIPISWLHLNSRLKTKRKEGDPFCTFQEVVELARDPDIRITDRHTLAMVLTFFHDRGDIIFFDEPSLRDDVTLQPQVMIDAFKTIITVPPYQHGRKMKAKDIWARFLAKISKMKKQQTGPDLSKMWERLEQEGILSDELLTRIWEKKDKELKEELEKPFLLRHKSFLKALMEKFYLICNATPVSDLSKEVQQEEIYFVPALLSCKRDNAKLYPRKMHVCPQALYFVFSEKFLPSGMFCRLQALCVRRFGLKKSCVFAGCARFPTGIQQEAFVITKLDHYLKVELLSSSKVFTEGLRVRKFLSSALFEIKEKWIPCIQYKLFCHTKQRGRREPVFRALPTSDGPVEQDSGVPSAFRDIWMAGISQAYRSENSGGDGPVILQPKGDPSNMRTIGPVLDTMELGRGLSLDQCDHTRSQLTPKDRVNNLVKLIQNVENRYQLGAAVEMCCPEFADCFLREERGKELVILHTDDYMEEFVLPLQRAASESGVSCHTENIEPTVSITEKTVDLLLNTNNRMVALVISPQTLHHRHWSNLDYEFPVRNDKLLLPILLYPPGSRDRMARVLQQRAPVLCSLEREEIEMEGRVSDERLEEIVEKVVSDKEREPLLYQLSRAVGEEWTRLGQELGMDKPLLDNITGDDDSQKAFQMLKAWRTKTPHGPLHYLPQLEETLQNIGKPDRAAAVQEMYKKYSDGLQCEEVSPEITEDKHWSLHLPGEGKYLCSQTDLGVVTPYPLHVTYKSANWSDHWQQVGEWMPVGQLFSILCEDVEGSVDILLPHVLHLADNTEITRESLQVVHVVGDSVELLPVTELTSSHAVTRFKKGSLFGVVGRTEEVNSVSRSCLLMAFRSLEDSDLSQLKVYIVSNTKEMKDTLKEDERDWNFVPCDFKTCLLNPGDICCLKGIVKSGEDTVVTVDISPEHLVYEDTFNNNKSYEPFRVEVTADIWMDNTLQLHLELLKKTNDEAKKTSVSKLKLGRYKQSTAAEGGGSNLCMLNFIFMFQDDSSRVDDLPTEAKQSERSAGGFEVRVVLLVNDEYGASKGGVSAINCQLGQLLAEAKVVVYSTALLVPKQDQEAADRDGVQLIQAIQLHDESVPTLDWLTYYHSLHYPNLPQDVTCIIGHADITDTAARNIWEQRYPQADLVTFTHILPEDTEYYKGGRKAMKAKEKENDMLDKANNAKAAFSVGKHTYDHFDTLYKGDKKPQSHFIFLPKPSKMFLDINVRPGGQQKVVLAVGRVYKAENLEGHDLTARAMGEVVEVINNVALRVRGLSEDDWERSKKIIEDNLNSDKLKPSLLQYGTQEDIRNDMMTAHLVLMPSRSEPFGLVGLEAIAAGIPVLISDKTGLAELILELIKQGKLHPDRRQVIVKTNVNNSDLAEDAKRWASKIVDILKYSDSEFEKAAKFKQELVESRYWEESHLTFLQACGVMARATDQ